jgi:hypothetical protein
MEPKGTENVSGYRTFQATAVAIAAFTRVTVDSAGLISAAGATENGIGVTTAPVTASGYGTVKLWSASGTFPVTASAAVARGAALYPTASGKVDDAVASGGPPLGLVALEAATADGDPIEAAKIQQGGLPLGDGTNIATGTSVGTKIGTAATQKLALWGALPVVQPSGANQAAVSTTITATSATATNGGWGADTEANFNAIVGNLNNARTDILALTTLTNALRAAAVQSGAIKGSA